MSIQASNIHVTLSGQPILKDINAEFSSGQLIGLIGPNGAGKSTLLRVLAGLQMIQKGHVSIDGKKLQEWHRINLAKKITYLSQSTKYYWPINVERLVMLGRHPHIDKHRIHEVDVHAVKQAIKDVDIEHLIGRSVSELSGGEQARVMLARALATESDILLADEPIVSFDPQHQIEVMELLQHLAHIGKTVIVVLHELHLAMRFCQQLILMDKGQKIAEGRTEDVLSKSNLHQIYGIDALFGKHQNIPWVLPWSIKKEEGN